MSDEKIPDRIKAKLTIELDFAKEDQPLIGEVLQGILDNLGLSSEGSGSRTCLLYTSPSPRDRQKSRMPSSA